MKTTGLLAAVLALAAGCGEASGREAHRRDRPVPASEETRRAQCLRRHGWHDRYEGEAKHRTGRVRRSLERRPQGRRSVTPPPEDNRGVTRIDRSPK